MEVFTAASLAALVWKFMSFLKDLVSSHPKSALTQGLTWLAGIGAVLLAAQADVAESVQVFGTTQLGDLDFFSLVIAGIALSSTASVGYDVKKAIDTSDTAAEPRL